MSEPAATPRRRRTDISIRRGDRMIADLLRIEQVWSHREDRARWLVHQIHRADRRVTLRSVDRAKRIEITFRQLRTDYALVLLHPGKRGAA